MILERGCPVCGCRGMRLELHDGEVRRRHETIRRATAICGQCDYRLDGEVADGPEGRFFLSRYRRDMHR